MSHEYPHRVLLAVDGSVHANQAAQYLASYGAIFGVWTIIVLHVQSTGSSPAHSANGKLISSDMTGSGEDVTAEARRILDAAHLPYAVDTEFGDPADVIVREADAERVDEIILGSRGMSRWTGLVLGSVAYKVIHRVGIPTTVVGVPRRLANDTAKEISGVHRILLAVDGSKHASQAIDYICRLRNARNLLEVELLNVTLPMPPGYTRGFVKQEIIDNYHREQGESALQAARNVLHAASVKFNAHIVPGLPPETIVDVAKKHDCTRIVMGTRGLGTINSLVLGSVAYKVLHLSPLPVTLVK
jgi:nucleotide-binding universal stress UspA family protein